MKLRTQLQRTKGKTNILLYTLSIYQHQWLEGCSFSHYKSQTPNTSSAFPSFLLGISREKHIYVGEEKMEQNLQKKKRIINWETHQSIYHHACFCKFEPSSSSGGGFTYLPITFWWCRFLIRSSFSILFCFFFSLSLCRWLLSLSITPCQNTSPVDGHNQWPLIALESDNSANSSSMLFSVVYENHLIHICPLRFLKLCCSCMTPVSGFTYTILLALW